MSQWFPAPDSGRLQHSDWSFAWTIHGHHEGLTLLDVKWKGTQVLYKASMPVIRVKYRGGGHDVHDGCGPFADRLGGVKTDEFLEAIDAGFESNVAFRLWDDINMLEMFVYDRIGGYDLFQSWFIWPQARLEGVIGSAGWSCGEDNPLTRRNHRHHPYWRLDFDVESVRNEVWLWQTRYRGGTVFRRQMFEGQVSRTFERLIGVDVRSTTSDKYVRAYIDGNELRDRRGSPWFAYSNKDVAWRRYHGDEDAGWEFGAMGHLGYANPWEPIDRQDVVVWLVGHMSHNWDGHDPQGHETHYRYLTMEPSW